MASSADLPSETGMAGGKALVFDSGVGGLTVVEALRKLSPGIHVDYAADTGFFPYGDKSDAALRAHLPRIADQLVEYLKPDVFVIACNTASTLALPEVRERLSIPVVGTVPAIKPAAHLSQTGRIGLLATPGTVRRDYTSALIEDFAGDVDVLLHGSLELVSLAEAVARGEAPNLQHFASAQQPLFDQDTDDQMDVVVLACTHFPLVKAQLAASAPRKVRYVDSGEAIARQTGRILSASGVAGASEVKPIAVVTSNLEDRPELQKTFKRFGFPKVELLESVADGAIAAPASLRPYR
ncbi:MAG: glutamate racemase [Pseudomonadota bacterium]